MADRICGGMMETRQVLQISSDVCVNINVLELQQKVTNLHGVETFKLYIKTWQLK